MSSQRGPILGRRSYKIKTDNLSRLLLYVLGHRPDEFGLVPDRDGFFAYKELLQSIHEEPGWQYVRRSHINEVLVGKDRRLFQSEGNRIRVLEMRWQMDLDSPSESLPSILFTAVRARAHPVVMAKGLKPPEGRCLSLSPDKEMALRIGKRRDPNPVVLNVKAAAAQMEGVLFYPFGDLFLSHEIPAKFVAGPPVSKEALEKRSAAQQREERAGTAPIDFRPGTFLLDLSADPDPYRKAKGKKRKGWKEKARKTRRSKGSRRP